MMARPASKHPTELELQILKILWQESPRNVHQVQQALAAGAASRDLSYSSVVTVLNIMVRKRYLKRAKQGRAYVYEPCVSEKDVHRGILGDLLDRVFDGSPSAVMLELLDLADLDEAELEELRKLINRTAKEQSR